MTTTLYIKDPVKYREYRIKALKKRILDISYELKLSHIGSCLTALEIIYDIYKKKKEDEKFVLSSGHAHLAHAVVMEEFKVIKDAKKNIEEFGIHCDRRGGCDFSTGSLGHGIGAAVGMALANRSSDVYCLISDGEMAEGSVGEALRIKDELGLDNLVVHLNFNGWAAYKKTYVQQIPPLVTTHMTALLDWPNWLNSQLGHYKVLNEEEYEECVKILQS